mmetsp:Transcript_58831/g.119773  ORF Transcript_58831/g.119773 Transcript_58831/m.119773 type:complete len:140 (+) Transcript_58831:452-871(+)
MLPYCFRAGWETGADGRMDRLRRPPGGGVVGGDAPAGGGCDREGSPSWWSSPLLWLSSSSKSALDRRHTEGSRSGMDENLGAGVVFAGEEAPAAPLATRAELEGADASLGEPFSGTRTEDPDRLTEDRMGIGVCPVFVQ